jgi:probable rRNA maturation factor
MGTRVKLNVINNAGPIPDLPEAVLKAHLRNALQIAGVQEGVWTICLLDDVAMGELHERTMGLNTTTDVLTFDGLSPSDDGGRIDLESALCVDEARRRAAELGHPLLHELLLYGIHSLLHVLGYDDITSAKFKAMHRREDEILTALGIGPVFGRLAAAKPKARARK